MVSLSRIVLLLPALLPALLLAACSAAEPDAGPVVLAASSMQEALEEAADSWATQGHARPVLSFAATSALARQVEAGAPADLLVSADEEWMDALASQGLIDPASRRDLAGNRLVLVARAGTPTTLALATGVDLAPLLGDSGRLAIAEPDSVPAGRYGKAALTALGAWPQVADRLAIADNVRGALALVARGEAPLGVVYATDARAEPGVQVAGVFPAGSHPPIRYPLARLTGSAHPEADALAAFLVSPDGQAILARHGFTTADAP
jgi:molybdate transport system substrate-binding protein